MGIECAECYFEDGTGIVAAIFALGFHIFVINDDAVVDHKLVFVAVLEGFVGSNHHRFAVGVVDADCGGNLLLRGEVGDKDGKYALADHADVLIEC